MPDGRDPPEERYVSREEFAALTRRVWELEQRLRGETGETKTPLAEVARRPEPPRPSPPPAARSPAPAPTPAPAPREPVSLEAMLGQQWAPRLGGLLVFLASLFFLGLAIERGWVTPGMQLAIATLFAAGLLGAGAWLTTRRGYGTYPQVLEGTGVSVLYVTAFVAHAVPYYQRATGLTEAGGGVLMALVAAGTVGLALHRDARVIAGLGYGLGFLTAGLGFDVLPALTLAYVALLGASLALVVASRGWAQEALGGTVLTGGFLLGFAMQSADLGSPTPLMVTLGAAAPFAAFVWLTLRPVDNEALAAAVAALTVGWAVVVTRLLLPHSVTATTEGLLFAAWCAAAVLLTGVAVTRSGVSTRVAGAYGALAVVLYLVWPPVLFADAAWAGFGTTAAYAAGALALAGARTVHGTGRGTWVAALALGGAAALHAVFVEARPFPGETPGTWETWATLLLVAPVFALLVGHPEEGRRGEGLHRVAFVLGVAFVATWAFALFGSPFLVTLYLVLAGGALVATALLLGASTAFPDALLAGVVLVALAAGKAALWDAHGTDIPGTLATLEALLVAGTLLGLYHAGRRHPDNLPFDPRSMGPVLVGGSAVVLGSFLLGYGAGAWVSVALGVLGVLYLGTGFGLTREPVYRWTGFAVLGFVVLRVFSVDLANADLAVRAIVFLALGAILLGVGYGYARANRPETPPTLAPEDAAEPPGGER